MDTGRGGSSGCKFSGRRRVEALPCLPGCGAPTIPGEVSSRACPYYGARWLLAPVKGALHLVHAPVGCAYYGGSVRGKAYRMLSTALDEKEIIFGSEAKLARAIREAVRLFPEAGAIFVYGCCAAGLTGTDIDGICTAARRRTGRPVVPVGCAGFAGTSQGDGHAIAAAALVRFLVGRAPPDTAAPYDVNVLGEFNNGGDLGEIEDLLGRLGLRVRCAFTGKADITALAGAHHARLNLVHCRRTGGPLAEAMAKEYGIPHLPVNFFGLAATAASLRETAARFGRERMAEEIIRAATTEAAPVLESVRRHVTGLRVGLYFGASRVGMMAAAFRELGMDVVFAGAQFGLAEDYAAAGAHMTVGGRLKDDASQWQLEDFLLRERPDLFVGGTRERFLAHKYGVPFMIFPQKGKPYAGFNGFVNFARDIVKALRAPVWQFIPGRWAHVLGD
ncbi:MAG: nitrogenase component 1 [Bacillota bacterium]|nr:nitrogenase component 1 [Bacillota bacterium]